MAKRKTTRSGRPQAKSKPPTRAKKLSTSVPVVVAKRNEPSLDELSFRERQDLLHSRARIMAPLLDQLAELQSEIREEWEAGKEMGVPRKNVVLLMALNSKDAKKRTAAIASIKNDQEVARMCNLQGELFPDKQPPREEHLYELGRVAAFAGEPRVAPSFLNPQDDAQHWLEGHAAGCEYQNARRAAESERALAGFQKLGEAAPTFVVTGGEPMPTEEAPLPQPVVPAGAPDDDWEAQKVA